MLNMIWELQSARGEELSHRDAAQSARMHSLAKGFEVPDKWYYDFITHIAGRSSDVEK